MTATLKNILFFICIMALAGTAGFLVQQQLNKDTAISSAEKIANELRANKIKQAEQPFQMRPEFAMEDIEGNIRNISDWDGQIIFLNFWATWCPPCLKEIPAFIELQAQYGDQGFQIVGIAIDDESLVKEFAQSNSINYPIIASEAEGIGLAQRYGNQIGGLPYTAIINRKGEISRKIMGELSMIDAIKILKEMGINT